MDFFAQVESIRERWNVLEHSFYKRWSDGSLDRAELAFYAGEYRHAVVALADGVAATAARPDAPTALLEEHAAEEAGHVELWDAFAGEVGADTDRPPRPETRACADSWTAGQTTLEGLVAAYTIESGQPAISQSKLDGLKACYGFEEGPATEYFALHAERDHEHAAQSRALIEERLAGADHERLLQVSEGVLRGNWQLLDGVERQFGREDGCVLPGSAR